MMSHKFMSMICCLGLAAMLVSACQTGPKATTLLSPTATVQAESDDVTVTYIGNAGFMVTVGDKKILVDALFTGLRDNYALPKNIQDTLTSAQPPFDDVDLILVTHGHADHWGPGLVQQHLQNNPHAKFASTTVMTNWLPDFADRLVKLDPTPGKPVQADIDGIQVEALSLSDGFGQSTNIGFVVSVGGVNLFFSGDIDTSHVSFEEFRAYQLPEKGIDIAFIPHFYFTDIPAEQKFLREGIASKYLVPTHYYYTDPPLNRSYVLSNYPDAIFFNDELQSWDMPPEK
jgi:L-ascorbate metabolism protein UlaG (beta-lactamase superfamily)